ncbi:hypothetical protein [Streptomyces coeruleorubidus]|uniref:hypothetical protein n=1 Tax=Streptomyces coeruleorubidus TaxID=116188 RepID=UPI0037B793A2
MNSNHTLAAPRRTCGDHDPSGIGAWRDLRDKLTEFAPDADIVFDRLAVTEEQITELELPTRPTKRTDTRTAGFEAAGYGESVEVDAIPPDTLRRIVRDGIEQHIDPRALRLSKRGERRERQSLFELAAELEEE